jgi:HTH-type transcriptional regulator, transcriptional repressor of NAD biosynthesis genes
MGNLRDISLLHIPLRYGHHRMAETAAKKFRSGIVFGKFYPLTRGHQFLIETAIAQCERLLVSVSQRPSETIPGEIRVGWIRQLYPEVHAVLMRPDLPYVIEECSSADEFYRVWLDALLAVSYQWKGFGIPQACFTSEPSYDPFVRNYLRADHVVVDAARQHVPIHATKVRADPFTYWNFLDPTVRGHFVKTACIYGPESCGKSSLSEKLAMHFDTIWQPEFARDYLGERHCVYEDMEIIAEGHLAERRRLKKQANKVFFVDTNTITTSVYSRYYYENRCPHRVEQIIELPDNRNDLYLLLTPEVPWVADTSRDLGNPQTRQLMFQLFKNELKNRSLPFITISGKDWDQRLHSAIAAVNYHIFGTTSAPST